jgi:SAM-dependent methyltransferase
MDSGERSERLVRLARRLPPAIPPLGVHLLRAAATPALAARYLRDRRAYQRLPGAEPLCWRDALPKLGDRLATTPFDSHYFFQDVWAARQVAALAPERHVDVGSLIDYVGLLTAICEVVFIDIRPLAVGLDRLQPLAGSILDLPLGDCSVASLSCLHVAEHIGLGRYGDPLDPLGTRRAASELQRVLAPGGQLLFSLPVGRPRVCFNAHRVHDPQSVLDMFDELELLEFAGVDDEGNFLPGIAPQELAEARYSCGMYRLRRPVER